MASIYKEMLVESSADEVWAAVRDAGAVHRRLVPGILIDAHLDGDARVVTFANGMVVRERLVTVDDAARRFVYAAVGGRATHHNASLQVFADGPSRSRLVWITDLLPDEVAGPISALVDQGAVVMKQTLEGRTASA